MLKALRVLLILNAILMVAILLSKNLRAQIPAQTNADGIPFFNVNINPTNTPPMVNVNPFGVIPKVEVTQMPPFLIPPSGCADHQNFETSVGRSISGPLVLTYLNLPAQTQTSLGNQSVSMSNSAQLASAIYLPAGQRLSFNNDVLYSGCRPQ
jgi:hypothetical protein